MREALTESKFGPRRLVSSRMPLFILTLMVIIAVPWVSAGAGQPAEASAKLGQEFTLSPGQSAGIAGEQLKIQFKEVVADSRCPTGVQCVWEGEVSCLTEITFQNSTSSLTLTQRGSGQAKTSFNNYEIKFEVQPYPEANKQIDKKDYQIRLVINKI